MHGDEDRAVHRQARSNPPLQAEATPVFYRPREFQLAELEGFSSRSIELHLDLYRAHVDRVNGMLARRPVARLEQPAAEPAAIAAQRRGFAFDYNGMVLHELFFEELTTALGTFPVPGGQFAAAAERCFGGIEAWKQDLRLLSQTPRAGWVLCMRERASNRIFNVWVDEHGLGLPARTDPVLVVDLWEHAWLSDYRPAERSDYVEMLLTQLDWQIIEQRFR
jgi:Fe-Mn family superoxide dismutase